MGFPVQVILFNANLPSARNRWCFPLNMFLLYTTEAMNFHSRTFWLKIIICVFFNGYRNLPDNYSLEWRDGSFTVADSRVA